MNQIHSKSRFSVIFQSHKSEWIIVVVRFFRGGGQIALQF